MAVTAKQVYDQALVLLDEVTETGTVLADQPEYYQAKTLSILTSLQAELLPLSEIPTVISSLSQELLLPDRTCLLVLPYGLAAHLLIQEDVNTASFYNSRYDELKVKIPTEVSTIESVYGLSGEY